MVEQFRGIGVDEERAAASDHDAVGVGVGLHGRDGLGEPSEREVDRNGPDIAPLRILEGLAVGGDHLLGIEAVGIEIEVRFGPARLIEQFGHLIPVEREVFVVRAAFLLGEDLSVLIETVGREILAFSGEIIRLEGDGAAVEFRIVLEDPAGIDEHRVGRLQMPDRQPVHIVGGYFHPVEDVGYPLDGIVEYLFGAVEGFLTDRFLGLGEHESQGSQQHEAAQECDPQGELGRHRPADEEEKSFHRVCRSISSS